jgi:homoserine O-acetyltransferase
MVGWVDRLRQGIDLEKYFVVCVNLPGSCFGTTAPASVDPATGKPYGSRYPWPTIEDSVHSQKAVLEHLGISRLRSIAGGSLGGMQVLMWTALYPEMTESIMAMACGAAVPVEGIAWHIIGRKIIESDMRFHGGDYYANPEPLRGLQVARMVGHMTYLSVQALQSKFGRRRRGNTRQFEIDSYFEYRARIPARQYDAHSYIRVQAMERDGPAQFGSPWKGVREMARRTLVSFDHRLAFPGRGAIRRTRFRPRHCIERISHRRTAAAPSDRARPPNAAGPRFSSARKRIAVARSNAEAPRAETQCASIFARNLAQRSDFGFVAQAGFIWS